MADFLLGCDVGTTSTKTVVIDDEGTVLGTGYADYPLETPRPGIAEHDPELYWRAVCSTVAEALSSAHVNPREIRAIGLSALSPACILVDRDLNPLQKAHIWMDRRGTEEAEFVKRTLGLETVHAVSGNTVDPFYAAVKLLWEKRNRPDLYDKTFKFLTASDYPVLKLTGKAVTDLSSASVIGIVFDIRKREWDCDLIEALGLAPEKFPEPYPSDAVVGEVTREAADATGLVAGTPVVAGTVDCMAACVAEGTVSEGSASLVMGTGGSLAVVHRGTAFPPEMVNLVHAADSAGTYITVAAYSTTAALLKYFRDNFAGYELAEAERTGKDVYDIMTEEASRVRPCSDGMIVLPYFMGERSPVWDPYARGTIFGMSLAHTRAHLIRAMMEGVAFGVRQTHEIMKEAGIEVRLPITLSEGGARSRLWRQIICDVCDVTGAYLAGSHGAPYGDAIIAGVGAGVLPGYEVAEEWREVTEIRTPDAETRTVYDRFYPIYLELYKQLKPSFRALANAAESSGNVREQS